MAITFSGTGDWRQGSITIDADAVVENLDIIRRVQMPFVMSYALNKLGPVLKNAHRAEMSRVFENPVPFTLNSTFYTRSDKTKLYSYIGVKDFAGKGNAAAEYLFPTVNEPGGSTSKQVFPTRFQRAVRRANSTMGGGFLAPITKSRAARLNSYGNISPGQYTQVLFAIGAYSNDSYTGRRYSQAKKPPSSYFLAPPNGARFLKPGVYRRSGRSIDMLFKYLPTPPTVQTRYDFYGVTDRLVGEEFPRIALAKLKDVMGGR